MTHLNNNYRVEILTIDIHSLSDQDLLNERPKNILNIIPILIEHRKYNDVRFSLFNVIVWFIILILCYMLLMSSLIRH